GILAAEHAALRRAHRGRLSWPGGRGQQLAMSQNPQRVRSGGALPRAPRVGLLLGDRRPADVAGLVVAVVVDAVKRVSRPAARVLVFRPQADLGLDISDEQGYVEAEIGLRPEDK